MVSRNRYSQNIYIFVPMYGVFIMYDVSAMYDVSVIMIHLLKFKAPICGKSYISPKNLDVRPTVWCVCNTNIYIFKSQFMVSRNRLFCRKILIFVPVLIMKSMWIENYHDHDRDHENSVSFKSGRCCLLLKLYSTLNIEVSPSFPLDLKAK